MPASRAKFSDIYDLKEEIGKGGFSTVYRCVDRKTYKQYAAKVIKKNNLDRRGLMKLEDEERICRKLDHVNIVKLNAIISEPKLHYFVFDLVTGGELFEDIVKNSNYTEEVTAQCMAQLLDTVKYVHHVGVVHRDLKPENILLESTQSRVIKLADFGLAVEVQTNELKWFGLAGSPPYMAPEVLEMQQYGRPVDMWACGVVMYILLVGYHPFQHHNEWKLQAMIKSGDYEMSSDSWNTVSEEAKNLITKLMCVVPARRYTAGQALEHSWLKKSDHKKIHRQDTLERLKEFNARRKFKAAVHTVHMIKSLRPSANPNRQNPTVTPSSSSSSARSATRS